MLDGDLEQAAQVWLNHVNFVKNNFRFAIGVDLIKCLQLQEGKFLNSFLPCAHHFCVTIYYKYHALIVDFVYVFQLPPRDVRNADVYVIERLVKNNLKYLKLTENIESNYLTNWVHVT